MSASPADATAPGRFFDGVTAAAHSVQATLAGSELRICDVDGRLLAAWPLAEVAAAGPPAGDGVASFALQGAPARLLLPRSPLAAALPRAPRGSWLASVVVAAAVVAVLALALLPFPVALVPGSAEREIGRVTEAAVRGSDRMCSGAAGQAALDRLATRLAAAADLDGPVSVGVIDTSMKNAFALPGRRILVLRGLLRSTDDGGELAGVMAHEMGHLTYRDPTRKLARVAALLALRQLIGLDIADLAAGVGLLTYDRQAEARADATGVALLHRAGLRADGLSRFLATLDDGGMPGWLSTHPPSGERRAATATDAGGEEPFTAAEWLAVRRICDTPQ